jgi:hypothetical protein
MHYVKYLVMSIEVDLQANLNFIFYLIYYESILHSLIEGSF